MKASQLVAWAARHWPPRYGAASRRASCGSAPASRYACASAQPPLLPQHVMHANAMARSPGSAACSIRTMKRCMPACLMLLRTSRLAPSM